MQARKVPFVLKAVGGWRMGSRFVPASICRASLHPQCAANRYSAYCDPVRVMYGQAPPISSPVAGLTEYQHKMITRVAV